MQNKIIEFEKKAMEKINSNLSLKELDNLRVEFLGKKGYITEILKGLKDMSVEEKKSIGKLVNEIKINLENAITKKQLEIEDSQIESTLKSTYFDISFPGNEYPLGSLHPVTIVQREIEEIFTGMGFMIADGPEVETDYFNFQALNIPPFHPARDMQDTYYLENGNVLRTQTSACQGRVMKTFKPPLKVIAPGRCFRSEAIDASHDNTFFQLEGMMIDKNISIANLIYVMKILLSKVFKSDVTVRLRPGFFPFVEPGFELDMKCLICGGASCKTCKNSGWIEVLPCGMIHPNVLIEGGIDPNEYSGFAFGLGLTRLAMMKFGINDIRVINSGSLKHLKQLGV